MTLLSLPQELQLQILSYLSPSSLSPFSLANSTTHHLANDPSLWTWFCVRDHGVRPRDVRLSRQFYREYLHPLPPVVRVERRRARESWISDQDGRSNYDVKRTRWRFTLSLVSPGLVGAETFDLCMDEDGKTVESFLIGSRFSTVQIDAKLQSYDLLFYVPRGYNHDVVSVNTIVAEYNRFVQQDFN